MTVNTQPIAELLEIVKLKHQLDQQRQWSNHSHNYLDEIRKELDEVKQEMQENRSCYLEDELGDVLWDYLNLLNSLEAENSIQLERVFARALSKYHERVNTLKSGGTWADVKQLQKQRLAQEFCNEG